jgi:hypothetical protein
MPNQDGIGAQRGVGCTWILVHRQQTGCTITGSTLAAGWGQNPHDIAPGKALADVIGLGRWMGKGAACIVTNRQAEAPEEQTGGKHSSRVLQHETKLLKSLNEWRF